jgi:hypothetical protein
MQPPFLIKHHTDSLILKPFMISPLMSINVIIYISRYKMKRPYEKNTISDATAERGAHFHQTVGSMTPNVFTTSHPRDETTMLGDCISICQ